MIYLGLHDFLLINIYEGNASKLLFNAFMKNVHILGRLSFRVAVWEHLTISEGKLWTCIGVLWNDALSDN